MVIQHTGAANSVTIVASYPNLPGMLGKITSALGDSGGSVAAVDLVAVSRKNDRMTRRFTVNSSGDEHAKLIVSVIEKIKGVKIDAVTDPTYQLHAGGKIEIASKRPIDNRDDISKIYTPGVARISRRIAKSPDAAWELTAAGNTVAVVSDGSAVLGLGNIGARAALPVMEGKALLFKKFANVDAWPIVLDTQDPEEIIAAVKAIAPGFGGINLEDISSPKCFMIEERLRRELDIPVFHDDQHGTAVVVLAALMNALKLIGKRKADLKTVVIGPGAAGTACVKIFLSYGLKNIIVFDRQGSLSRRRKYDKSEHMRQWLADNTNPDNLDVDLTAGLKDADFVLGLAGPNALVADQTRGMADESILFALSNPDPEIRPEDVTPNVRIVATGRSDYPNQVNNSLCFPGMFRGVLDVRATDITDNMKLAAAEAIAGAIPSDLLSDDFIIPGMFESQVVADIAQAVGAVARRDGVARLGEPDESKHAPEYMVA